MVDADPKPHTARWIDDLIALAHCLLHCHSTLDRIQHTGELGLVAEQAFVIDAGIDLDLFVFLLAVLGDRLGFPDGIADCPDEALAAG